MTANTIPQRGFPTSAREGLNHYLELGGGRSSITSAPEGSFGHLSAFIQRHSLNPGDGEGIAPPYVEVVSDALYVPYRLKPDGSPLGKADVFVVKTAFMLSKGNSDRDRQGKFRLDVTPIGGKSRDGVLKTLVEEEGEATIRRSDVEKVILSVVGGTQGRGSEARVVKPVVHLPRKASAERARPSKLDKATQTVLRLLLTPDLDPAVKRAELVTPDRRLQSAYMQNFAETFALTQF